MRINDLFEGLSPILYHTTTLQKAISILTPNRFRLSQRVIGDERIVGSNKSMFYMSTSRIPYGGIQKAKIKRISERPYYSPNNNLVTFVLDGNKLSQNYAGEPVEYHSMELRRFNEINNEFEDRIYSNKSAIENFVKYILQIHILIPFDLTDDEVVFLKQIKRYGIPVYYYTDGNDFLYLKHGSSDIPFHIIKQPRKDTTPNSEIPQHSGLVNDSPARRIARLIRLRPDDYQKLNKEDQQFINYLWKYNGRGIYDLSINAFQLLRNYDDIEREEFASAMRGIHARNPDDLRDHFVKKWNKYFKTH